MLEYLHIPQALFVVYAVIIGAVLASFLGVVSYRVPLGLSIVTPGSHCSNCKHSLKPLDLIPIISYLLNGGKCRFCKIPYGNSHLILESVTAVLFGILSYIYYGEWLILSTLLLSTLLAVYSVSVVLSGYSVKWLQPCLMYIAINTIGFCIYLMNITYPAQLSICVALLLLQFIHVVLQHKGGQNNVS